MNRNCPVCNVEYNADPNRLKWGRQTTCSRKCSYLLRGENKTNKINCTCGNCGKSFTRPPSRIKSKHNNLFCSPSCQYQARSKGMTPRIVENPYDIVRLTKEQKLKTRRTGRKKLGDSNPKYRIINALRVRLYEYLKQRGYKKDKRTFTVVGCSPDDLRKHLEGLWEPWMSWDNYGLYKKDTFNYGWDIDHIIPTSSAKTEEEIYELNHYTNLKPLCSKVNRDIKKDKV